MNRRSFLAAAAAAAFASATFVRAAEGKRRVVVVGTSRSTEERVADAESRPHAARPRGIDPELVSGQR
jgi:hypothetical protein